MTRSSFCVVQNATNAVFTAKLTQILHNLRFQGLIEDSEAKQNEALNL